ncbi:TerC family protein [Gallaecimonas kandeliae]|uniref:TerC family protein n=1 Tax=Gallaecimonas kandeliae TaxID=3029055 RepID=UPI002649FE66|nr:TerC family protein [Gallaecimonas kandeliae]WKE65300.1 TerC family protein [Gallaecimonas kandeliae]
MEWLADPSAWVALATLTALEIVLGVDNIIFISVLVGRLPEQQRQKARLLGLALAMGTRILLLLSLAWVMGLTSPWFSLAGFAISGRDSILILGGLFLIWKSTHEIHNSLEGAEESQAAPRSVTLAATLVQIALIDIVFSLDSVITAVGLANHVQVMIIAIVLSVLVMMAAAKAIGDFVDRHPSIKMLALSFLILVGFTLTGEGFGLHIPKGYVYFAMAFSLAVETLNLRARKKRQQAVKLHKQLPGEPS